MCVPKKKNSDSISEVSTLKKSTTSNASKTSKNLSDVDVAEEKTQKDKDQNRIKQVFAQMNTNANAAVVAKMLQEERAKAKKQIKTELAVGDIGFSYQKADDDTILERKKKLPTSSELAAGRKKKTYKYERSVASEKSSVEEYHLQLPQAEDEEPTPQKYMHLYKDMEYMTHEMIYNINAKDIPKVSVDRKIVLDPLGPLDQLECPVFTWEHLKCNTLSSQVMTMPIDKEKTAEEKTAREVGVETHDIRVRWANPVIKKVITDWLDEQTAEMPSEVNTGRE